ncbi:hypothetical protein D3C86_1953430 [compost metagenome]
MCAIERGDEVGLAVAREKHGQHQAAAWPGVVDTLHVDELADPAGVPHCLLRGQCRALVVVSEDFAIHCLNIQ